MMEFIGNRIQGKVLAAIFVAAFFTGRIVVFGGSFPAALAFMTAMLTVSTVYIYLLPAVLGAMLLCAGDGIFVYGDMLALLCLSLFFLFFHRKKFSNIQRVAAGGVLLVLCNLAAYAWADMLVLLKPELLAGGILAFCVYLQAFDSITKVLYRCKETEAPSKEQVSVSLTVLAVSFAGAAGPFEVVFSLWFLMAAIVLYNEGIKETFMVISIMAVFSFCQGELAWQIYPWLFTGVTVSWYMTSMTEVRYRKPVMGIILFFSVSSTGGYFIYGCAAAAAVFVALPHDVLTKIHCLIGERFLSEASTEKDLQHLAITRELQRKQDAFRSLGRLYGSGVEGKQIVSYQFMGMARTIDRLVEDLRGNHTVPGSGNLAKVSVGQASYSFDGVSGDNMAAFAFDAHHLALIISDGMGKGKEAAEESKLVVTTLSRLLQAGFDVDLAMKTINGILMTGNDGERFATVDLAIIDRAKGRAKIYKMGAATTFLKHGDRVSMLKRQALPAGITSGLDLEYIDVQLRRGDLLVMVSDGVTDCDRKDPACSWLRERLLEIGSRDPETVAELVVNKAAEKYGIRERDDLTVMTAAIGV